jgi:hypothetical protein
LDGIDGDISHEVYFDFELEDSERDFMSEVFLTIDGDLQHPLLHVHGHSFAHVYQRTDDGQLLLLNPIEPRLYEMDMIYEHVQRQCRVELNAAGEQLCSTHKTTSAKSIGWIADVTEAVLENREMEADVNSSPKQHILSPRQHNGLQPPLIVARVSNDSSPFVGQGQVLVDHQPYVYVNEFRFSVGDCTPNNDAELSCPARIVLFQDEAWQSSHMAESMIAQSSYGGPNLRLVPTHLLQQSSTQKDTFNTAPPSPSSDSSSSQPSIVQPPTASERQSGPILVIGKDGYGTDVELKHMDQSTGILPYPGEKDGNGGIVPANHKQQRKFSFNFNHSTQLFTFTENVRYFAGEGGQETITKIAPAEQASFSELAVRTFNDCGDSKLTLSDVSISLWDHNSQLYRRILVPELSKLELKSIAAGDSHWLATNQSHVGLSTSFTVEGHADIAFAGDPEMCDIGYQVRLFEPCVECGCDDAPIPFVSEEILLAKKEEECYCDEWEITTGCRQSLVLQATSSTNRLCARWVSDKSQCIMRKVGLIKVDC